MRPIYSCLFILVFALACSSDNINEPIVIAEPPEKPVEEALTDSELLDFAQRETFAYFWDFSASNSGAARERYLPNEPETDKSIVTTGGSGFGLMALLVGIEKGFITREEGITRISSIVSFFETADRYHGAWPHWINDVNGNTIAFSDKDDGGDIVETSFLVQGLICVKEYFSDGSAIEKALALKADTLWKGVEWNWYTQNQETLYWHWSPNVGFDINLELKGYNEVLLPYVLAAASTDYAISKDVYTNGWASNGNIVSSETQYNIPLVVNHTGNAEYGGPLFWSQYSYLGLDPRNLSDDFVNYNNVNINHAKINYQYCVENPNNFIDYGENCWGLTSSYSRNIDGSLTYRAHQPGSEDVGVISPTAALSSMPYTPEESMRALRYFYANKDKLVGAAGFYDAFSPQHDFWVANAYLGIDQGPIIIMIENHRTGLLWNLFMKNADVQAGLSKLDFSY